MASRSLPAPCSLIFLVLGLLLPAVACAQSSDQQKVIFWNMQRQSVDMLIHHVPQSDVDRLSQLKQTFSDLECKGDNLYERPAGDGTNLICKLPGTAPPTTRETILLTANYKHEGKGMSAIDNWSGAIMLPFLYHALAAVPRRHTFIFAEVNGEAGTTALFHSMPSPRAVVAFDALGLGPPAFYIHPIGSVPTFTETLLKAALLHAADEAGRPEPEAVIPGPWFKVDTTRDFRYREIASILIHSGSGATRHLPGSTDDLAGQINSDAYFDSYKLLCFYVVALDQFPLKQLPAPQQSSSGRHR
jgi:hypothetical protein